MNSNACNACGARNSSAARSCEKCGAVLGVRCPVCAAVIQSEARFCSACGQNLATAVTGSRTSGKERPAGPAGERKQVTILFADFSGYTAYSGKLDPEDLRDNLGAIWAMVDSIIAAHGGTTEKHIGDAVMALFGGRRSREEDPVEAVRAALAIQAWLKGRKPEQGPNALQMRIGIHTGMVVVGPADNSGEFLATGDAVSLTSRLEQQAPVGGVLVSRETFRLVYGLFDAQAQPPLQLRGKAEPFETYIILRAKPRALAMQIRGAEGREAEMIGRQKELNGLLATFERALEQCEPQAVTLAGDAGLGKSRLFREFKKRADLLPQYFRFFAARTSHRTAGAPFAVFRDLLSARFEMQESDSATEARDKFERGMTALLIPEADPEAWSSEELRLNIHFIGQLLGLDYADSPHLRDILADAEQIRQRAFHGFSRFIAAISRCPATAQTPEFRGVLLMVEDLHWCDEGSLDLIEHLIRNCQGVPLMILCSARPVFFEGRRAWCEGLANMVRLNLEPLSESESHALVKSMLRQDTEIAGELWEMITEGAGGNPFYIEEKIKMLMDQRVIFPHRGHWKIEPGRKASSLPSTLTGVLQARLDGLPEVERVLLQRAAVVGRVFWDSAVECMGFGSGPNAAPAAHSEGVPTHGEITLAWESLRQKELVFRRESSSFTGAAEYTFKHELLRNVAYESLLKKSRRQYHARIAEWLKDQGADRLDDYAGLVATHLEQASQWAEASEWHGRAGQQARLGYSPAIAMEHFQKALHLLEEGRSPGAAPHKQELDWQEGLGESLCAQARFSEAMEVYAAMRDLAKRLSDPVAEARAWNGMAFLHERRGDNRASIECAERAEMLARGAFEEGRAERVRALHTKAWAYYRLGDASAVLALGDQTLRLCADQADRRGTAMSFKLLGVAHLQLAQCLEADRYFTQGLELFEELGDRRNTASMWNNRGETARACGDYNAAVALYENALAIARQIGNRESELVYLTGMAGARLGLGQFEQAERELRQVLAQTATPNSCALPEACTFLAEACLGQGKISEAGRTAEQALVLAQDSESSLYLGCAWRAMGRIGAGFSKHYNPAAAVAPIPDASKLDPPHCFAESLRVFRFINAEGEQARTLRAWGEYEIERGHHGPGRRRLLAAGEIFQRLGARLEVQATEYLLQKAVAIDSKR